MNGEKCSEDEIEVEKVPQHSHQDLVVVNIGVDHGEILGQWERHRIGSSEPDLTDGGVDSVHGNVFVAFAVNEHFDWNTGVSDDGMSSTSVAHNDTKNRSK